MRKANNERTTRVACSISLHEPRRVRSLSSYLKSLRVGDHEVWQATQNDTHVSKQKMTHPNENFPFHVLFGQAGALGLGSQPDEVDLFAGWFTDKPKNFRNATRLGLYSPLDLNVSTGQGLPPSPNQEAPLQQLFCSSRADEERWKVDFIDEDDELVCDEDGKNPMLMAAKTVNFEVKRILVDSRSMIEGDTEHSTIEYVQFFVVDPYMTYNAIFGHSIMRMARMMVAIFCMKIKFPTKTGVGAEAIIPVKIGMRSHRTTHFDENANQEAMKLNLDLVDEVREVVEIKNTLWVQQVARCYNSKFKNK
ncbi:hypothetical protein J1N35_041586 [Gossypium stocksii]|uniref:Uncharacterized protein n=1 Tax=Gossypium stocksii TaxID=47602 RepID=A0A9D3UG87_9ROSI|nr:hypothetical protein J1N35_041586 [Gossypium stocksii]